VAAIYLTNQYKDDPRYQNENGEFIPNLLPESVKTQIRDLTAGIGAVIGEAAGDSSYNAQLAGVIGQNNVDSYKDIQNAKVYSEQMYKDTCAAYGLGEPACGIQIRKDGYEILKGTALVLLPTEPYELIPIGKGVGIVIKGIKKIVAVYKDAKAAEKALNKARIENNIYTDGEQSAKWTSAKKASNNINLAGHWEKHKTEFPELKSQNEYYRFAQDSVNNPPKGTLVKIRKNGDSVFYQPSTKTFAVKTKDGLPRTVFKPDPKEHGCKNNLEYYNAQ